MYIKLFILLLFATSLRVKFTIESFVMKIGPYRHEGRIVSKASLHASISLHGNSYIMQIKDLKFYSMFDVRSEMRASHISTKPTMKVFLYADTA